MDVTVAVQFTHRLRFTRAALEPANRTLADVLADGHDGPVRVLAFVDTHVARAHPDLPAKLNAYAAAHPQVMQRVSRVEPVVGGELCKNDRDAIYRVLNAIASARLDRQSVILAIGGGAVLDCVGFAAAIAHRGMRLVRLPTTTLAQADSGVGVKCGINGFEQKNYLGAFAVPWAVINDEAFLPTLNERDWRSGFSEAVKVALLKDTALFDRLERDADAIAGRDLAAAAPIIARSAELHLQHIAGGDPFELGRTRPLDFGHWAAHRLEVMTDYAVRHGEAVAVGMAIDIAYAQRVGLLAPATAQRVLAVLRRLGFALHHPALADADAVLVGLEQFREHLGGELTVPMVTDVGRAIDVHDVDRGVMRHVIASFAADAAVESTPTPP